MNFDILSQEGQYYLEINFYDFKNTGNVIPEISPIIEGNANLKTIFEVTPSPTSIFKSEKSFYVLNNTNEELIVKILAIISKTKENVG